MVEQLQTLPSPENLPELESVRQQFENIVAAIEDQVPETVKQELERITPTDKICGHRDAPGVGLGHN
jgi:hypothetical protein